MEEMRLFLEEMDRGRKFRKEEEERFPKKPVSIDPVGFDFIVTDCERRMEAFKRERERERVSNLEMGEIRGF